MTRHAALVVTALGRSPYMDEVIHNTGPDQGVPNKGGSDQGGPDQGGPDQGTHQDGSNASDNDAPGRPRVQRYDSRGHPINLETRHRERMEVQAGNEVLQVAGIVETFSEREERERTGIEEKREEKVAGLLCNRAGHAILVAGMWGVSGLRRRLMLYEGYSRNPFADVLRQQTSHYGLGTMLGPGIIALTGAFYALRDKSPRIKLKSKPSKFNLGMRLVTKICGYGLSYGTTYLQMLALLDQVGLGKGSVPSLWSLIPLSKDSLIQFQTTDNGNFLSLALSITATASPITLVYFYGELLSPLSNWLFCKLYALVLLQQIFPLERKQAQSRENLTRRAYLQALRNNGFAPPWSESDTRQLQESHAIRALLSHPGPYPFYELHDDSSTLHRNEALRLLEGRHGTGNPGRGEMQVAPNEEDWDESTNVNPINGGPFWSNDPNHDREGNNSESTQVSWAQMISVEVVDHGPTEEIEESSEANHTNPDETTAVTTRTEAQDATATTPNFTNGSSTRNPANTPTPTTPTTTSKPKPEDFHVTYLTMLPNILLSRTLSMFAARTILIPLEILMVRTVANSYLQHQGLSAHTLGIYSGISIPTLGWKKAGIFTFNLLCSHILVLVAGGVVWGAVSSASMYLRNVRTVSERGPVEIEVGGEGY